MLIHVNFVSIEWDEVALHRQEDGGIDPGNETVTEIDGEDGRGREDEGTSDLLLIYHVPSTFVNIDPSECSQVCRAREGEVERQG